MELKTYRFPDGFLWGSAISAFQAEGCPLKNEWCELANRGKIFDGRRPEGAVKFWDKYRTYIALMKEMNDNIFRMSVEWAHIEPEEGLYDESALQHYREIISAVSAAGIKPIVDLHHHSNPLWLAKKGGWCNRSCVADFRRFTNKVINSLGDLTDIWLTINEPVVLAVTSYMMGLFPPQKKNIFQTFKCIDNLAEAHVAAYEEIHNVFCKNNWPNPTVGFAKHVRCFNPFNPANPLDKLAVKMHEKIFNLDFFDKITRKTLTLDTVCINYYTSELVKFPLDREASSDLPKNKLGWDIYPEGFYHVLKRYWDMFHLPIYVTENGVCDDHDELRPSFILDHVYQMHRAVEAGVDVRAYCHWTTMDNFECMEGLSTRFGLIHVDFDSKELKCTIKPSGRMYGEIAGANGITPAIVNKYKPDWHAG